jgi:hypothetical protein
VRGVQSSGYVILGCNDNRSKIFRSLISSLHSSIIPISPDLATLQPVIQLGDIVFRDLIQG